jgi:hypothetical protein
MNTMLRKRKRGYTIAVGIILVATMVASFLSSLFLSNPLLLGRTLILFFTLLLVFALYRDNRGKFSGLTVVSGSKWILNTSLNAVPLAAILVLLILVDRVIGSGINKGVDAPDDRIQRIIYSEEIEPVFKPYPWRNYKSWIGVNKALDVPGRLELEFYHQLGLYDKWAVHSMQILRTAVFLLLAYWRVLFVFLVLRTFGYVAARTANASGVTLKLSFRQ